MKINDKFLPSLPLTFQQAKIKEKNDKETVEHTPFISIKEIGSDKVFPQNFYKPISKTIPFK